MNRVRSVFVSFVVLLLCFQSALCSEEDIDVLHFSSSPPKKVAVVGAGIAGSSFAYYLHQHLPHAQLVVFEKSTHVGGRTTHVLVEDEIVEIGGSIYVSSNRNIEQLRVAFNLSQQDWRKQDNRLGIWNGESFSFMESDYSVLSILEILWRYGLSPFWLRRYGSSAQEGFISVVYDNSTWKDVKEVYQRMPFREGKTLYDLTQISYHDFLKTHELSEIFENELITTMTRNNYGQYTSMNALGGLIAFVGSSEGLFGIEGGNRQLSEKAIQHSQATLRTRSQVTAITKKKENGSSQFTVESTEENGGKENKRKEEFDLVVIATPLELTNIEIKADLKEGSQMKRDYVTVHVTIVIGDLSRKYFKLSKEDPVPNFIGVTNNLSIPFSSIGSRGTAKSNGKRIWKIFSSKELTEQNLDELFEERTFALRHTWEGAYPVLTPAKEWPPLILDDDGLFYLNAMESPFSCIETEIVSAKNVAKLIKEKNL